MDWRPGRVVWIRAGVRGLNCCGMGGKFSISVCVCGGGNKDTQMKHLNVSYYTSLHFTNHPSMALPYFLPCMAVGGLGTTDGSLCRAIQRGQDSLSWWRRLVVSPTVLVPQSSLPPSQEQTDRTTRRASFLRALREWYR